MYPVFPKSLYSFPDLFAVRYLWVVCNEDECCVVTHRRAADFALLGLFRFAPIACHGVKRVQARKTRFRRSKAKLKRTLEKQYISRDRSKLVCEVRRNENCSFISIFAPILRLKYFCSQQSVVVEEIQEVELRFRRALFIYFLIIQLGYSQGHAPSSLLQKRRKVSVFVWKVSGKISFLTSPRIFSINPQPRSRSVRSHKSGFLIHVLLIQSMFYQSSPVHVLSHAFFCLCNKT